MDTGEYICQLLTRILMELPIPLPAQEVENCVPFSENAFLHQLQNHKETCISTLFFDKAKWYKN